MTEITQKTEYDWFKAALAGKNPPVHDGVVQSGRFRKKMKDGPAVAVAIWRDWANGGTIMASYDLKAYRCDKLAEPTVGPDGKPRQTNYQRLAESWPFLSKAPIAPGLYDAFYDTGCTKWPDESQAGADMRAAAEAEKTNKAAAVTYQFAADTWEGVKERLDKFKPQALAMIAAGAATDQISSDIAADLKNTFLALQTTAEKLHKAEKEPHLTAGRLVDARWKPLKDDPEALKNSLARVVITPYQQKAQAALDAQHAASLAEARENNVPLTKEQETSPRVSSGTVGRKVTPRSVCHAVITDPRAFLAVLAGNDQIHPGIMAAMQAIADAGGSTDPAKCATYNGVTYEQRTVSQ